MEKRTVLVFEKMGMDITDKDYAGDIGNHRVRARFEDNFLHNWSFVRWFILNNTGVMFENIILKA